MGKSTDPVSRPAMGEGGRAVGRGQLTQARGHREGFCGHQGAADASEHGRDLRLSQAVGAGMSPRGGGTHDRVPADGGPPQAPPPMGGTRSAGGRPWHP